MFIFNGQWSNKNSGIDELFITTTESNEEILLFCNPVKDKYKAPKHAMIVLFVYKTHILKFIRQSSLELLILLRIILLRKLCTEASSVIHTDTLLNPS